MFRSLVLLFALSIMGSGCLVGESPYLVAGMILDEDGQPVADVVIHITDEPMTHVQSNTSGAWSFWATGQVTINPHKEGYWFEPSEKTITGAREDVVFTAKPEPSLEAVRTLTGVPASAGLVVQDGYLFSTDWIGTGMGIFDLSDPEFPTQVGHYTEWPSAFWGLDIVGDRAYVTCTNKHLIVMDISDKSDPRELKSYNQLSWNWTDVQIHGSMAYAPATRGGLYMVNLTTDEYSTLKALDFYVYAFDRQGSLLYLTTWELGTEEYALWIYDLGVGPSPVSRGNVALPSQSYRVLAHGDYVYVGTRTEGLKVVRVSDVQNPTVVATIETAKNDVRGLFVQGNYLFATDMDGYLYQFDITDAANPVEMASIGEMGSPRGIWVEGGIAYVADTRNLHIIRVIE